MAKKTDLIALAWGCFLFPASGFCQTTGLSLDNAAAESGFALQAGKPEEAKELAAKALDAATAARPAAVNLSGIDWGKRPGAAPLDLRTPPIKIDFQVPRVKETPAETPDAPKEPGAGATLKKAFLGLVMIPYVMAKAGIAAGLVAGEFVKYEHPALGVAVQIIAVPVGLVLGLAAGLILAPIKFVLGLGSAIVKMFRGKF